MGLKFEISLTGTGSHACWTGRGWRPASEDVPHPKGWLLKASAEAPLDSVACGRVSVTSFEATDQVQVLGGFDIVKHTGVSFGWLDGLSISSGILDFVNVNTDRYMV